MGKPTGFLEFSRKSNEKISPKERIKNYNEFYILNTKDQQKQQGARCMDCGVPFCQSSMTINGATSGCPLNNLIPEWNDLVFNGEWDAAANRLLLTNNFPEFTSRVCPALCEAACTCGIYDNPVTVHDNERVIIEEAFASGLMAPNPPKVRTEFRVAVVGSGPAGLAAAAQLNKRGHNVTVYERSNRAGGLLMYGIPNMKLDKSIIKRRIELMEAEGVTFATSINVGKHLKSAELLACYDAVVLACGASNPRDLKAPGREATGIHFAVDFLKSTTSSLLSHHLENGTYISAKDKNVIVVGGGDTGNDCVGTVIRHGCKSVVQLEMMPKLPDERQENNPWPQWPKICKTDYGQEEAIAVFGSDPRVYQTTIKEFLKNDKGELRGVITVKVAFVDGKIQEVEGSEVTLDADIVLIAAGFLGTENYVAKAFGVDLDARTNVITEKDKYSTNVDKIFVAGDMHRGQSLVVWAIREGRQAAKEVDEYLMGYSNL